MADVYISMGPIGPRGVISFTGEVQSEVVTSSGTAADSTATANDGDCAKVYCATSVWVSANGTATAANSVFVPGGTFEWVQCYEGQPISVIDA